MAVAAGRRQTFGVGHFHFHWRTPWTVIVALFWIAILVGTIGGYFLGWNWTGFKGNGTLWDWLSLLGGPVFVSALPFLFRGPQNGAHDGSAEDGPPPAAMDEQQEAALGSYQEYMFELLLNNNLIGSQPGSDVREVARARTLTALRRVGTGHKREIVRFLYEAGLIAAPSPVVDLHGADLSGADLSGIRLTAAELSGSDLSGASLARADLSETSLRDADLSEADLTGAKLGGPQHLPD